MEDLLSKKKMIIDKITELCILHNIENFSIKFVSRNSKTMAYVKPALKNFTFNIKYVKSRFNTMLNDLIIHEIAHVLAWEKYGDSNHGSGWFRAMNELGVQNPLITY